MPGLKAFLLMRRFSSLFFSVLLFAGTIAASAQVVSSATGRQVSITAGGMASIFQPDFAGIWTCGDTCQSSSPTYIPVAGASNYMLFGVGAYVDVRLRRWVQLEAEGRWLRWNQYGGINQDNYLIGPRVPVYRFWKATFYGKALGGYAKMNFGDFHGFPAGTGRYTDFAFGGGVDVKLTKHIILRAADVEYQYYPWWPNSKLSPYGASVGIGYKIF
jgi:hypothetical protein